MKLEDQLTSLELSKKLKELGVKQKSLFYYSICNDCTKEYGQENYDLTLGKGHGENYSAFTSSEILKILPLIKGHPIQVLKGSDMINGIYYSVGHEYIEYWFLDKNLSNSCAKMIINLIENNLMEIK